MAAMEKLVNLSALQTLAEKVNSSFATKTEMENLAENAGEENVLEAVRVNGEALEITDRAVDLEITTGTENGTIAVSGTDVVVQGLGTLAYASEVSESDLSTDLQSTLSGKAESSGLEALETLVGTLPEDAESTTVVDYVSEAVSSLLATDDEVSEMLTSIFGEAEE